MGFALTLFYIALAIISPDQFGPAFAGVHPMIYLAAITALASLPEMFTRTNWRSSPQTYLMLGFVAAIPLSQVANQWFGGAVDSLREILPSAAIFFFIVANVSTLRRLKIVVWVVIATCLSVGVEAMCGYYGGFHSDVFAFLESGQLLRLRAAGFLNDPNDFAQMLLIALPLMFIWWKRGRIVLNTFTVLVPAVFLLWAIYLTHSRGALVGLGLLAIAAFQNKLGKLGSVILGGALVFGMMAFDFTGGRGLSDASTAGRVDAWYAGLQVLKRAPLFGIGFGGFTDINGITAHNSFVLCLAELGLVGSTILVALFTSTLIDLNRIINSQEHLWTADQSKDDLNVEGLTTFSEFEAYSDGPEFASVVAPASYLSRDVKPAEESAPILANENWPSSSHESPTEIGATLSNNIETEMEGDQEDDELRPFAAAMRLALLTFIATSFFLSRSYVATIYLVLGLAATTIALGQPAIDPRDRRRWVYLSFAFEAVAILSIYLIVRLRF
jgi:putative inorganic carbon (HCO3(-)) transporter